MVNFAEHCFFMSPSYPVWYAEGRLRTKVQILDEERQWRSHILVPHPTPAFLDLFNILFVFWLVESSIICKSP